MNIIDMYEDDDRFYRADALLTVPTVELAAGETRAVFIEAAIPAGTAPGEYEIELLLLGSLPFEAERPAGTARALVTVAGFTLHGVTENRFHLDLWQHCSNIARKEETPI